MSNKNNAIIQFDLGEPLIPKPFVVQKFMDDNMFERVKKTIEKIGLCDNSTLQYHPMIGRWEASVSFDEDIEEYFLHQIQKHFNNKNLVKAYFFACRYQIQNGCIPNLWEHFDQNGTQTTIDITIENTAEWDICVDGERFQQNPNDAIMFCGQQHMHGRPPYPTRDETKYSTLLFLHYTEPHHWIQTDKHGFAKYGSDGDKRFFNINRFVSLPDPPVNQPICSCHNYAPTLSLYDEVCGNDCESESEISFLQYNKKDELAPGIILYKTEKTGARTIKGLVQNALFKQWKAAEVLVNGKPQVDIRARNCFNYFLGEQQLDCHPQDPIVRAKKSIEKSVDLAVNDFCQQYSINGLVSHHTVLLRYEDGNMFHDHFDLAAKYPRVVSSSMFLNDDFDGGELVFKEFGITVKPEAGDILVFCSSFPYMHRVNPVKLGIRYAAVKWYQFDNV